MQTSQYVVPLQTYALLRLCRIEPVCADARNVWPGGEDQPWRIGGDSISAPCLIPWARSVLRKPAFSLRREQSAPLLY